MDRLKSEFYGQRRSFGKFPKIIDDVVFKAVRACGDRQTDGVFKGQRFFKKLLQPFERSVRIRIILEVRDIVRFLPLFMERFPASVELFAQ